MSQRTSRRQFLTNAGTAGAGFWIAGRQVGYGQEKSPNAKLNIACIGTGGQGGSDMGNVSSENIVALCDIDDKRNDEAAKKHPNAKKYYDYRKMLEEMAKEIDAVTVGTPDHHHAPAAVRALRWREVTVEPGLKVMVEDGWAPRLSPATLEERIRAALSALSTPEGGSHGRP